MIHPHTELRFISNEIGYGVFATKFIPRGAITWALCHFDQIFTPAQVEALPPAYQRIIAVYCYVNAEGDHVLSWDLGRYVNHSCDPASLGVGDELEIAVRDIHPGEEITDDYGALNLATNMRCRCGAPNCRGIIRRDDVLRHWQEWDAKTMSAFSQSAKVPQPLLPFLKNKEVLEDILGGRAEIPSHLSYYCPRSAAPYSCAPEGEWNHVPLEHGWASRTG